MRSGLISSIVIVVLALALDALAQADRQTGGTGSKAAASSAKLDPHDLSGIWNRTGGDRGFNNDVPPFTREGERKFSANKQPWVSETKIFTRLPKEQLMFNGWFGFLEGICAPIDELDF